MKFSIAIIILLSSLLGMAIIIFRKIPVLITLPESIPGEKSLNLRLKRKISKLNPLKNFSYEIFLQKILTKIRILSLKTDCKTFNWLQELREKNQKKKIKKEDNYWEEIQKSTKK